jgi:ATP-dependent HslUV protease, peptidase subunit HslV
MSTVVAVKKNGFVAIAADTLSTFGSRKLLAAYSTKPGKIIKVGESYIGLTGWAINQQVLEHAFLREANPPAFSSEVDIFDTFLALHTRLKQDYFLTPRGGEEIYEPTHVHGLIANAHGLFGIYSMRDVIEYERFWASGSGGDYALGALHALYGTEADAVTIARAAVRAAVDFDDASAAPVESHVIRLADMHPERELALALTV